MSHPELKQLTRAEHFFDAGKLDKALEILNNWSVFKGLDNKQKSYYQLLKGLILMHQYKQDALIEFGEKLFKEGQSLNDNLQSFDGLFLLVIGLSIAEKYKEAYQKIEIAEELLGLISNVSKSVFFQRKIRLRVLKGWINLEMNNQDLAEKCLNWVINSHSKLGNTFEIVWATFLKARLIFQGKSNYDLGGEYTMKALSMAKQIKFNHFWIALGELYLGAQYIFRGENDISLEHHMKSLEIFREIKNNYITTVTLLNIGVNYSQIGNIDLAMKYWKECLSYHGKLSIALEFPIANLVEGALEMGDNELAQHYFNQLENLYSHKKNGLTEIVYLETKALMLKNGSRIRDKAKAEKIFRKIIDKDTIWGQFAIGATIHLCHLLLSEYRFTNSTEVLDELNHYIGKLLALAEKTHSYTYFSRTFMLKAKLALINFDLKAARRFLTQAQKIAETHGLKRLAMKISHDHDELLEQISLWERLKESNASISERWKLAGLNEQMENIVRKKMVEDPKLSKEDPVILLIISEGGIPLFSHSFIDQKSIDSEIFGGFLTTIDYFIKEMFSEGLDRAIFGEYTLLMKSIPPFYISYIFKGDSYYALQKTDRFIEQLQTEGNMWQKLIKYSEISQKVHIKDIPSLGSLITETYIK